MRMVHGQQHVHGDRVGMSMHMCTAHALHEASTLSTPANSFHTSSAVLLRPTEADWAQAGVLVGLDNSTCVML